MERYMAVDNVCAWPNLTRLPNGEILAVIFGEPSHGRCEGDVECWASVDDGRLWTKRGVPAPHESSTARMNVAAGLAHNGDLVVISSGWGARPPKGKTTQDFHPQHILPNDVCRSGDGGRTWTHAMTVKLPPGVDILIPFGDVIRCPDGALVVSMYGWGTNAYLMRSRDDGYTWGEAVVIAAGDYNETAVLQINDRCWIAASRKSNGNVLDFFTSDDDGRSWRFRYAITGQREAPGHLLRLADGRILLTYTIRRPGLFGLGALEVLSNGEDFGAPIVLLDFADPLNADGGYPATVQVADGTLVTAYYAQRVPEHQRYHMGILRWQWDEAFTRNRPLLAPPLYQ